MAGRHRLGAVAAVTEPQRQRPKQIEDDDLDGAMIRLGWVLAGRAGLDPDGLAMIPEIDRQWQDAKNVAYALANNVMGYQALADITGVTKSAAQQRCNKGREIIARREAEAAATGKLRPISTRAERREIRARAHINAGVPDRTAGPKLQLVYDRLRAVGE